MPAPRTRTVWRHRRRSLFAALALVAYFAAGTGWPLPTAAGVSQGQTSTDQKGPCGCPIGEHLSGQCCCRSADGPSPWATPATEPAEPPGCSACTPAPKPCCSSHAQAAPLPKVQASRPTPRAPGRGLARVSAATCRCTATLWVATGEVCPPPPLLGWLPYLTPDGRVSSANISIRAATPAPPDPPPRILGA